MDALCGVIALGGASFSLEEGRDRSRDIATIRTAIEAGIAVVDSARAYAPVGDSDHNEKLFAEAIGHREDVLFGTKGGHYRGATAEAGWRTDNSPEQLRRDVERSLSNLGSDVLPLFYLHRADHDTLHFDDALAELDALRVAGKIARIGLSNVTLEQLRHATESIRIDAVQNRHSIHTSTERGMLAECERLGIPFFAYSPLRPIHGANSGWTYPALSGIANRDGVAVQSLLLRGILAQSPVMSIVSGASRTSTVIASARVPRIAWTDELQQAYLHDLKIIQTTNRSENHA